VRLQNTGVTKKSCHTNHQIPLPDLNKKTEEPEYTKNKRNFSKCLTYETDKMKEIDINYR